MSRGVSSERAVKDIRCTTRKRYSASIARMRVDSGELRETTRAEGRLLIPTPRRSFLAPSSARPPAP